MAKISKRVVDGLQPKAQPYCVWDGALAGFGVRVQPTGSMSYVLKYRASSGRQRWAKLGRVGIVAPDQARTMARAMLAAVAGGADPGARKMTVRELSERFLTDHVEAKKKPKTAQDYRLVLKKHILPSLGDCKAESLTGADVAELHRRIGNRDGAKYQANRAVAVISSMYTFGARQQIVPLGFNPTKGIERFREQSRERFLDADDLGRLGDAIREAETVGLPYSVDERSPRAKYAPKNRRLVVGEHAAAALRLLLFTGARLREILHLRWDEVDFERGMLRLPDSKTGKKAIVLNAPALALLTGLTRCSDYVIAGADPKRPRANLNAAWNAVRRRAGLKGVRIHDLRHTHASAGLGLGLSLPIIGKLLGHTQAATTQRYAHLAEGPWHKASNLIGNEIAAAMGDAPPQAEDKNKVVPLR
jgi:integrase